MDPFHACKASGMTLSKVFVAMWSGRSQDDQRPYMEIKEIKSAIKAE